YAGTYACSMAWQVMTGVGEASRLSLSCASSQQVAGVCGCMPLEGVQALAVSPKGSYLQQPAGGMQLVCGCMPLEGVQALAVSPKGSYLQVGGTCVSTPLSTSGVWAAAGAQSDCADPTPLFLYPFPPSAPPPPWQVFQRPSPPPAGGGQAESNLTVRRRPSPPPAGGGQAESNLTVFQRPSAPAGGGQAEPNLTVQRVCVCVLNPLFPPPASTPHSPLQVFQRPSAPAGGGQAEPNLMVRRVSDGEVVWRQVQKTFNSAAWWVGGGRDMDGGGYAWGGYGEGAVGLGERLGGDVAADAEDFQLCRMVGGGPSVQFSADESVACRPVNGEVQLFTGADLAAGVAARLKVPGMTSAQLAPSPPSHIAVFAPEAKGAPASVRIITRDSATPLSSSSAVAMATWSSHVVGAPASVRIFTRDSLYGAQLYVLCLPSLLLPLSFLPPPQGAPASVRIFTRDSATPSSSSSAASAPPAPIARRSFFKCSAVRLVWNMGTTAVLAWTHSDVDKTNQSYYGESGLHFLAADGSFEGAVPLSKEGPIHDVQWSPNGKDFVVVHGFMPAKATLFDNRCKPLFDFGSGPRNLVRWSPHGRFICLAGFGNLPGDVEVWERTRLKQPGKAKAPCGVSAEWSPDGRHILVATTAPRLQVDNGFKVFKYDGSLLLHRPYGLLYQAEWAPAPEGTYADRPPSPRSAKKDQATPVQPPAAKPAPYRPPNAALMTSTFRAQMSGEDDKPHKIGAPKKYIPPGAESAELSKSAKKNAKKREAAKAKKDAASPDQTSQGKQANQQAPSMAALSIDDRPKAQPEQQAPQAPQGQGADEAAEKAKRVRNLGKRLRQIEELKARVAAAGGSTAGLDAAQLEKLGQETAVRAELASLQG
ncbi:unnamed protein product, partial [Closterium sp. Naga37s-1]